MLLEIENVFGGYGNGDILKGISCSADYGDVLCLLGPNGCGKTTLFRMILGSLPVSNGKIKIAAGLKYSKARRYTRSTHQDSASLHAETASQKYPLPDRSPKIRHYET